MKKILKESVEEYWECKRCESDSISKYVSVPCPRGSCDALLMGDLIINKMIRFNKTNWVYYSTPESKKINLKEIHPSGDILNELVFDSWSDMVTYVIQNDIIIEESGNL